VPFDRDVPRRSGATIAKIEPTRNVAFVAFAAGMQTALEAFAMASKHPESLCNKKERHVKEDVSRREYIWG